MILVHGVVIVSCTKYLMKKKKSLLLLLDLMTKLTVERCVEDKMYVLPYSEKYGIDVSWIKFLIEKTDLR